MRVIDPNGNPLRVEFTPAGLAAGIVWIVAHAVLLGVAWKTLDSRMKAVEESNKTAAHVSDIDVLKASGELLKAKDSEIEKRLDRKDTEVTQQLIEIRNDIKLILQRTKP